MAGQHSNVADVVLGFVDAINAHDVERVVELVTDDAAIAFAGLTPFEGKDRVAAYFEWFVGYNARWDLDITSIDGDTARCKLAAYDEWSEIAGISPLRYSRVDIAVRDGQVTRVETEFTPETNQALSDLLEVFTPWASEHFPELYTVDGDYAYYLDTGARMVEAMREWKGGAAPT